MRLFAGAKVTSLDGSPDVDHLRGADPGAYRKWSESTTMVYFIESPKE